MRSLCFSPILQCPEGKCLATTDASFFKGEEAF